MITVLQVIILGQFIKSFVFDVPAPVSRFVNDRCHISAQGLAGHPDPPALLGLDALMAAHHPPFGPPFLGNDHED